ncbi:MFS transporter [Aquabacterium sp. J223]|nr:MFS transporter [Aquabacterium sp. J223]UUX97896.1 MFS transporter [Aquabacterium sp. J223]
MSLTSALPPTRPSASLRDDAATIGLVGIAHSVSHFSQLLLAPLFPWLKDAFQVSYAELGLLMTIFFVVSCVVQALAGFWVDRKGPLPVLFTGLACIGVGALVYAASTSYWMLGVGSVLVGIGNGVFHPVDYTLLNKRVSAPRLPHAYSVHGVTGSLGWAAAPALLVPLTVLFSWRVALVGAAAVVFLVLALVVWHRRRLTFDGASPLQPAKRRTAAEEGSLAFLRIPAVWVCFAFFLFYACAISGVQSFAPEAARLLHGVDKAVAAACLSIYMVASALGMLTGGFLVRDPARCERVIRFGFSAAALLAVTMALAPLPAASVPAVFALMGFLTGTAGPSRDLIVKRATPANATGRVYGVVYSGLDIGQALAPLLYGTLMDHGRPAVVWLVVACVQGVLIFSAAGVVRAGHRRAPLETATAG